MPFLVTTPVTLMKEFSVGTGKSTQKATVKPPKWKLHNGLESQRNSIICAVERGLDEIVQNPSPEV
jgi:hypothetical protein